jgi:hypothetical protein
MKTMLLTCLSLTLLLGFAPACPAAAAQGGTSQDSCDPNLHQISDNPLGYKLRGDRCEGIYIQPVSSSSLLLASFTSLFENFDANGVERISVNWLSPAKTPVRLRAYGLREKLYYQMDTVVSSDKTAYLWPATVLNSLHLSKQDVGVVGFTNFPIGGQDRTVYLPLRISEKSQKTAPRYQIVVIPGEELKEVFLSLAKVEADGQPHTFSISDRPLHLGYYPAERGIFIDIPDPGQPGIYYVEIGATSKYGNPLSKQIWFYHGVQ